MRFSVVFAGVLLLSSAAAVAKADSFVMNPNFTSTNQTFPGYTSSSNNLIAGWTGTGSYGATGYNVNGFWNNGTVNGSTNGEVGFIQVSGTLSTTLNGLQVGQQYLLSFLDNSRSFDGDNCCNAVPTVTASVGGVSLLSQNDTQVGGSAAFHSLQSYFTATGTSETLTFAANTTGGADGTAVFSNVQVTAVTPEPSSLALLGTGIVGAAGAMRKRFV